MLGRRAYLRPRVWPGGLAPPSRPARQRAFVRRGNPRPRFCEQICGRMSWSRAPRYVLPDLRVSGYRPHATPEWSVPCVCPRPRRLPSGRLPAGDGARCSTESSEGQLSSWISRLSGFRHGFWRGLSSCRGGPTRPGRVQCPGASVVTQRAALSRADRWRRRAASPFAASGRRAPRSGGRARARRRRPGSGPPASSARP